MALTSMETHFVRGSETRKRPGQKRAGKIGRGLTLPLFLDLPSPSLPAEGEAGVSGE